jgi:endonuclease-3
MARSKKAGDLKSAKGRARRIIGRLWELYPESHCSLSFESPLQLLIATILSAQCTDKRVNAVTPELFRAYPTVETLADAEQNDLEELIKTTGFFRNKAKSILKCCRALVEEHDSEVPRTMEELVLLGGVGRKTANVVMGNAFGIASGVVVDTHVGRISRLLGFTNLKDPVQVERDLIEIVPKKDWIDFPHLMIHHGRAICAARSPDCGSCGIARMCPSRKID